MKKYYFKLTFLIILFLFFSANSVNAEYQPPNMKIGLYSSDDWVQLTCDYDFFVKNSNQEIILDLKTNEIIELKYDKITAKYLVKYNSTEISSDYYLRVIPKKNNQVITLLNYENRPTWDASLNDNAFKGRIQLRYAAATDKTWVIEVVKLENYIKGIAEAGNDNDLDYLKALYTAARTYAYWHYTNPTKHADENYILDTSANDQVYRGYNFTLRAPNIIQAVNETRGMIVTYNNEIAITPYFSNSDGRTRSYSEVWHGDYPYLVSVPDQGCEGMTLLGHGVGLSAYGARYYAEEQNWGWKKILKYYYTGVIIATIS